MGSDPNSRVRPVVIDTNIVLDLLVFHDPGADPLMAALVSGQVQWLATAAMREELLRVLDYPKIRICLDARNISAAQVLCQFDAMAQIRAQAKQAPLRCQDRDDQMFLDLAVDSKATLLSRDRVLLRLAKHLLPA